MSKSSTRNNLLYCSQSKNNWIILRGKILFLLLLLTCFQGYSKGLSQNKITLSVTNQNLKSTLALIEKNSSYRILYNDNAVSDSHVLNFTVKDATINEIMSKVLANTGLRYQVMSNNLVVIGPSVNAVSAVAIKGKVTDEKGEPLPNVGVAEKNTKNGVLSSEDGSFTINVKDENAILVFTYVGYETQEIPVSGKTDIPVIMHPAITDLDQLVVVGYGTSRKKDLTGAIMNIKGEDLAKQPVMTATQALQGQAAGVQIISSGAPNSSPIVRIRGTGSMLSGVNPLYVVDGVITDDITNINSADILSMDILKDASATAIYGMRAANGVLIITTKKGRTGKMQINYDGTIGVKEAAHLVNMAGSHQYVGYLNEASRYYGSSDDLVDTNLLKTGINTDWYDAILRRALQQNNNVSISGGSDKVNYYLSVGYLTDEGIIIDNKFKRLTVRSNNDFKLSNKLKLSTLISFSNSTLNDVDMDAAFGNAYKAAPVVPSEIGGKYGNTSAFQNVGNPMVDIQKIYNRGIDNRLQGNAALEYKPVSWLTLRSSIGTDMDFFNYTQYGYQYTSDTTTFLTAGGNQTRPISDLTVTKNQSTRWVWDNTATATKTFGSHNVSLMVGTTAEGYKFNRLNGYRQNVPPDQDQWYLTAGDPTTATNDGTGDKWTRNSYIGRVSYAYADRYLLTATFRADGTSRFPSGNRWGYFPSVGAGWVISDEKFMDKQKIFNNLKLRASWGQVGNDQIPSSAYRVLATSNIPYFVNGVPVLGIAFDQLADQNLKWEINEEFDIGLDFTILNNRLSGTVDYYNKKTKDALINVAIPGILGDKDSKYTTNAATVQNKGVEIGLNWKDKIGKDWTYYISGNLAFNHNEVIGLGAGQPLADGNVAGQGFITLSPNGEPIGSFNVLKTLGIFQSQDEINNYQDKNGKVIQPTAQPGEFKYEDRNGDGTIDANDRQLQGSYQPKAIYGINAGVTYRDFDLSINTYGTSGGMIYNVKKALRGSVNALDNMEADVATDRWTVDNKSSKEPHATTTQWPGSSYFLESGNFFRINNVTIGYTLPADLLAKAKITKLRVYVSAQNLATFTRYTGFSPEFPGTSGKINSVKENPNPTTPLPSPTLTAGMDQTAYPSVRTWVFGLNLGF